MCEWIWFAGWGRLTHLALMRASAASARFSRINTLLTAIGLGLFQATRYGWRGVTNSRGIDPTDHPSGEGWLHVAATPAQWLPDLSPETAVNLWWNPIQATVAVVTGFLAGLLLLWLASVLMRAGVTFAHRSPYREEQRMTAALHYSTAWAIPIFVGILVACLRPISYIGQIARWAWFPPQYGFELSAAVVVAFGLALWWFFLLRLGATAPARTRSRVAAFFSVGAPMIVGVVGAGWWLGLDQLYEPLFKILDLRF